jgi:hypothetical protein
VIDFTTDSSQERLDPQPVCTDKHVANALGNGAWTCLEFLTILIHASEQGEELLQMVLHMLEAPMQAAPDVVLLGFGMLASMDASSISRKLPSHVISNMAPKVMNSPSATSRQLMSTLHSKAFPAFSYTLQTAYQADPKSITVILSIVQVCIFVYALLCIAVLQRWSSLHCVHVDFSSMRCVSYPDPFLSQKVAPCVV